MASALLPATQLTASSFTGKIPAAFRIQATSSKVCLPRRVVVKAQKTEDAAKVASLALLGSVIAAPAQAIEAEQIVSAIDQVESAASQAADVASQAFGVASSVAGQVIDAATPFVKAAAPVVADAGRQAFNAAAPVASDYADQASKAFGVELAPVVSAAKTAAAVAGEASAAAGAAIEVVSPYAESSLKVLLAQDASVIAVGAGGLLLLYLLAPSFFGSLSYAARGFAGEFSSAQALDLLSKEDYTLVDIRNDAQKAKSGIPSLPRNSKSKLVSVPVQDVDSKLRGQIRNSRKVEAEITAIKIAALKRLNKGSKVILIDGTGDLAKSVAQSLVALGFKNTWIVKDGVDGSAGWIQSRLATEGTGVALSDVLSPSRVISNRKGTGSGTGSGTVQVARRGFLLTSGSE